MGEKLATPDDHVVKIAEAQHGVISTVQLLRAGLTKDAIRGRAISGRLHSVHRGVYAVGHRRLAPEGRWFAAVLAVGGGPSGKGGSVLGYWRAAISHRSAACLWGLLPVADGSVDVTAADLGGRASRRGIRIHRSRSMAPSDVTLRDRIPVTTPARTIADLRLALSHQHSGALTAWELRRAARQAGVLGLPLGKADPDTTRSDLERDFLRLCRRHGLPPPEVNVRVGPYLVDFLWRERRVVVETDGYRYHRGRVAFQDDRGRGLELKRRGYDVVPLSERQVSEEGDLVAEVLAPLVGGGA